MHGSNVNSANIQTDKSLSELKAACAAFEIAARTVDATLPSAFALIASRMHEVNYHAAAAENRGAGREQIREVMELTRQIQAESPFVARLQRWPRGYQGDFETVEYLMSGENRAQPGTAAYWIEQYCLNTAAAQQHRNKVRWQADLIQRTIRRHNGESRILILACGSSPDVRLTLDTIADKGFSLVLNDMDTDALRFSSEKLAALGDRVKTVTGNTFRQINKLSADGPFDLVLAGGLFDYLNDDQAAFLIKAVKSRLLAPNGKFGFTNIAKPNPYKYWMEYCANWFLIERTEADVISMLDRIGMKLDSLAIQKESSGLSLLIEIGGQVEAKI